MAPPGFNAFLAKVEAAIPANRPNAPATRTWDLGTSKNQGGFAICLLTRLAAISLYIVSKSLKASNRKPTPLRGSVPKMQVGKKAIATGGHKPRQG